METRANHLWVGAVSLMLLAALAAGIIWLARLNSGDQKEYDIFFKQSVDGLARGSQVAFSGVPAGQVKTIDLWEKDPEFVRVRITVDQKIPILLGTVATVQGSFTGVSVIQLDGAVRGVRGHIARTRSQSGFPGIGRSGGGRLRSGGERSNASIGDSQIALIGSGTRAVKQCDVFDQKIVHGERASRGGKQRENSAFTHCRRTRQSTLTITSILRAAFCPA